MTGCKIRQNVGPEHRLRMNAFKPHMAGPGPGQRGDRGGAGGCRVVEPGNEPVHFVWHLCGGRRFEMNGGVLQLAGDDLHGVGMAAIGTDGFEMPAAVHQHAVPAE